MNTIYKNILMKIYIGENIKKYGILKSDINNEDNIRYLINNNLIKENYWYFQLYTTTEKGARIIKDEINNILKIKENIIDEEFKKHPKKITSYIINRVIKNSLAYPLSKPTLSDSWEDAIISNSNIWEKWMSILNFFNLNSLAVSTHDYSSSSGGEILDLFSVISPEMQTFLVEKYLSSDFSPSHEKILNLYPFFLKVSRILNYENKNIIKNLYFRLLTEHSVSENEVYSLVNDMSKYKITSEYHGILSDNVPFQINDFRRYFQYLRKNIINNSVSILMGEKVEVKKYIVQKDYPALSEIKTTLGFLSTKEIGDFYTYVSDLERKLRDFIKSKLGKKWYKRIEKDLPRVIESWDNKQLKESKWGIKPEEEKINYSDFGDYIQIISKYDRIFTDSDSDISNIITHLNQWYIHGRNPIMHARTIDLQKYFITTNAIEFLNHWMERKK